MRALLLFLILLLAASMLHAQSYHWIAEGTASLEDDYGSVQVVAMAVDSSDHAFVLVKLRGLLILTDVQGEIMELIGSGRGYSPGYVLVKYSKDGDILWARDITGSDGEDPIAINDLCADRSGAVYLTGGVAGEARFSTGSESKPVLLKRRRGSYGRTGFAVKYGYDGRVLWTQDFPTLPPGDRIGTDGDSTLYLLVKGRQGDDGPPIMGLQALDSAGRSLWVTTGPRFSASAFGVSRDGSAWLAGGMAELPRPSGESVKVMEIDAENSVPSLSSLPASKGLASLMPKSRVAFRFSRDGAMHLLFQNPYPEERSPDALYDLLPLGSLSFDENGHPFFASLISSGRPDPFSIGGKEMREKPGNLLLATLDRSATLGPMRWFPGEYYNSTVQRLSGGRWLLSGPLVDPIPPRWGLVRSQPHESNYVRDVVWMQLDSNLNPIWTLGGGGTSNYQTSIILPARDHSYFVASTVVDEAQLGSHLIKPQPRSGMFYVARIDAP